MNAPLFRQIGPYDIERQIGHGGIAYVFLARDTRLGGRRVALKVVPDGPDDDAKEIALAEQRGAELQRLWLADSVYVPEVYDVGRAPGYLYVAMEYLEGEDLAALIRRGPIEVGRATAIAIQLCRFLEEIDHLDPEATGGPSLTLLHNDLKPTNVRIVAGDAVKVLDFGAAKALSMSRRVTRNDFYSTPYLSPECLESGERDRQADAWALGVILYEMVAGRPPFRGDDTRRLESRIQSRRPPEPPPGCPRALCAVIGKLLAPYAADRYAGPASIREDLERFQSATVTIAESEGWPDRHVDEPATRRARTPVDDEPPTRRTPRAPALDDTVPLVSTQPTPAASSPASAPPRRRGWIRAALVIAAITLVGNEACVLSEARQVAAAVPTQEFAGLATSWSDYQSLRDRSYLGVGTHDLGRALQRQTLILAERVTANYRTPVPTVREAQWTAAEKALERALAADPGSANVRGTLRYIQGQLHRIDGEADKSRRQTTEAQRHFAEAVTAFREAASLRQDWPDPFLGLARTFIYGLEDIDRGADAMNRARELGHTIGSRETMQLADGYRTRGETLERAAATLVGMPQEREFLTRSRAALLKALEHYTQAAGAAQVPAQVLLTQRRLEGVERKLAALDAKAPAPVELAPGATLAPTAAYRRAKGLRLWV